MDRVSRHYKRCFKLTEDMPAIHSMSGALAIIPSGEELVVMRIVSPTGKTSGTPICGFFFRFKIGSEWLVQLDTLVSFSTETTYEDGSLKDLL